jgi:pSer/pThr/pTyr-binding forkhead associated (FHA) protein
LDSVFIDYAEFFLRILLSAGIIFTILLCIAYLFGRNSGKMILAQFFSPDMDMKYEINSWEVSIGRAHTNDIFIDNATVSRFHAVVARRGKGWVIYDTNSKAGTFVNGQQIEKKAYIFDGDIINLGSAVLTFRSPMFKRENAVKRQKAELTDGDIHQINATIGAVTKAQKQAKKTIPALVNLSDNSMILLFSEEYIIGRAANCDIVLPVFTVSKYHAKISNEGNSWILADVKSKSGTYVNNVEISEPYRLQDGDTIEVGGIYYRFVRNYISE